MYYWVYDIRTTMDKAEAIFLNRADAEKFGNEKFGKFAYISNVSLKRK